MADIASRRPRSVLDSINNTVRASTANNDSTTNDCLFPSSSWANYHLPVKQHTPTPPHLPSSNTNAPQGSTSSGSNPPSSTSASSTTMNDGRRRSHHHIGSSSPGGFSTSSSATNFGWIRNDLSLNRSSSIGSSAPSLQRNRSSSTGASQETLDSIDVRHHSPSSETPHVLSKLGVSEREFGKWWKLYNNVVVAFPEDVRVDILYKLLEPDVLEIVRGFTGGRNVSLVETRLILERFVFAQAKDDEGLSFLRSRKQFLRERVLEYILALRRLQAKSVSEEDFWTVAIDNLLPGFRSVQLERKSSCLEKISSLEDSLVQRFGPLIPFPRCRSVATVRANLTDHDYLMLGGEVDLDSTLMSRLSENVLGGNGDDDSEEFPELPTTNTPVSQPAVKVEEFPSRIMLGSSQDPALEAVSVNVSVSEEFVSSPVENGITESDRLYSTESDDQAFAEVFDTAGSDFSKPPMPSTVSPAVSVSAAVVSAPALSPPLATSADTPSSSVFSANPSSSLVTSVDCSSQKKEIALKTKADTAGIISETGRVPSKFSETSARPCPEDPAAPQVIRPSSSPTPPLSTQTYLNGSEEVRSDDSKGQDVARSCVMEPKSSGGILLTKKELLSTSPRSLSTNRARSLVTAAASKPEDTFERIPRRKPSKELTTKLLATSPKPSRALSLLSSKRSRSRQRTPSPQVKRRRMHQDVCEHCGRRHNGQPCWFRDSSKKKCERCGFLGHSESKCPGYFCEFHGLGSHDGSDCPVMSPPRRSTSRYRSPTPERRVLRSPPPPSRRLKGGKCSHCSKQHSGECWYAGRDPYPSAPPSPPSSSSSLKYCSYHGYGFHETAECRKQ
eukprot:TRINITY_DN6170_c0_g1_i1.p1 TRINITY_DN6170_c0_g1~~TRINITY_DN6170_c0_g1_i1.p1  ORF type:complete len:874 (-),score=133.91 TRINITY_DN6170_c0_g1_i1:52-2577(-)